MRVLIRLNALFALAEELAKASCCRRTQVACVIATADMREIVSIAYNGPAIGEDNDACRNDLGRCGCVHAESNAIMWAGRSAKPTIMIATLLPCELCSKLIVNAQHVKAVFYRDTYRDASGFNILRKSKIAYTSWRNVNDQVGEWLLSLRESGRLTTDTEIPPFLSGLGDTQ